MKTSQNIRTFLKTLGSPGTILVINSILSSCKKNEASTVILKGNIHHSFCRWCYGDFKLEELCQAAKDIGITSIELLGEESWPTLKKYDLTCAMGYAKDGTDVTNGFNNPANHDKLIAGYEYSIPQAAKAGLKNLICFSGNRNGLSDEQGLDNCAIGLKKLMPLAEKHKITLAMELLNSKVDHPDYQGDRTKWGVELCKQVGSENFKLLYDIYHMQIMEGDIIRTIRENIKYIAHFHTGGNPGRNEIDKTQELYYPAIMRAIVATGFKGFVAQEFIPKRYPLTSLRQAVQLCDI
jgi:hydroxypyruvate isomerase